jgi:PAS domain S-box-containing protein
VVALGVVAMARPAAAHESEAPAGLRRFRVFGGAEGLHNLVVVSIAQDASGALWAGTEDGLYRYDGVRFHRYGVDEGLPSAAIPALGIGPDGELCAGTRQGLACWDGAAFVRITSPGQPVHAITAIARRGDRLWVGTSRGLFTTDGRAPLDVAPGWHEAAPVEALWAGPDEVIAAVNGRVLATTGPGAWRDLPGLAGDRIDGIVRAPDGALWIRSADHVWRFAPGAATPDDLAEGLPASYDSAEGGGIMAIGARGDLWLSTDRGPAYRDGDHWRIIDRAAGLPAGGARTIFVDRDGTLWIGAIGLLQERGRGLIERHDLTTGVPGEVVWSIGRDPAGALWIGTDRCLARADHGTWRCLPGTEDRVVRSFVFPPQGGVFVGGAPADLMYIDPDGAVQTLGTDLGWPAEHPIFAMALGPGGDLWIATKRGLHRLPGAVPGRIERVEIPGVEPTKYQSSLRYADGRLWSATRQGLAVLEAGTWRVLTTADGLAADAIQYVTTLADHRICIGYNEGRGVHCFAWDGHAISDVFSVGVAEGMTAAMVYSIGEDRAGRLWLGTGDGVDVVVPRGPAGVDHFGEHDGLAGNDSTAMGFYADADGSIWLGAAGGLSHVHAASYAGPLRSPQVILRGGRLGDHVLGPHPAAGLEVAHDRGALVLELGTDSQVDHDHIEFQLRLSPIESTWSTTRQREARYPSLPPGTYRFEVRARIGAGAWGPVTALPFTVRDAWWQRRWFLALIGALVVGAIGVGFTWRQRVVLARRTEQIKAASNNRLRELLERVPDQICVLRDGEMIYLNRAARRFHALGIDDAVPDLGERIHPDDRLRAHELMERARDADPSQAPEMAELRVIVNGDERIVEISGSWIDLDGGAGLVVSGRDVTERARMRSRLVVSDRMASLGTLAAGVAHEINNPLTYVIGNLQVVAEALAQPGAGPGPSAELAAATAEALDGAERVRRIVQGLRSFSRSEEERRIALDLPEVLRAAIRLTANEVRHRAQLVCELGPVPRVIADDGRLTQVFINLIVNAAHAIPVGRSDANRITVRTRRGDDGGAVIEIEDTGRGMSREVQARAFDPFFTTKQLGEGTGLGLSICHGIIHGLGGAIAIDSTPGQGTTVRIALPAGPDAEAAAEAGAPAARRESTPPAVAPAPAPAPAVPVAEAAPPAAPRTRVLIVDDEPLVAETFGRMLSREHDVTVVPTGQAALDKVAGGAWFDAIVSDVMMPNMTGLELLDHLVRLAPEQARRLIFVSGGVFTGQARATLDALGTVQLEKPISARALRACVQRVAAAAR